MCLREKYNVIYADPPWPQKKGGRRKARPNQGRSLDYRTCSLEEIESHLAAYAASAEDDHNLFLWAVDKFLPDSEVLAKRLGYRLHARMVWDKTNGIAPAFTVRFTHEYLLWFFRGKFTGVDPTQRGKWVTVLREVATKHSRKPEIAYRFIESCFPNSRKIELYARERREGWDAWGDEVEAVADLLPVLR